MSDPTEITVIVKDADSNPAPGALVTISPSGGSGRTNRDGEVKLKLSGASKYDVTVTLDDETVTVPYYVIPDGSTRLEVPVRSLVEFNATSTTSTTPPSTTATDSTASSTIATTKQSSSSSWVSDNPLAAVGGGAVLLLAIALGISIVLSKRRSSANKHALSDSDLETPSEAARSRETEDLDSDFDSDEEFDEELDEASDGVFDVDLDEEFDEEFDVDSEEKPN
jgi:hypothetical protein